MELNTMITEKITDEEMSECCVASLPTRPNAPGAFGGRGFSAQDMKEAFDRLPRLIAERLNSLIDDVHSSGEGSVSAAIPTGISDGHTLAQLFSDIISGAFASYLRVGDYTLEEICRMLLPSAFKEGN